MIQLIADAFVGNISKIYERKTLYFCKMGLTG